MSDASYYVQQQGEAVWASGHIGKMFYCLFLLFVLIHGRLLQDATLFSHLPTRPAPYIAGYIYTLEVDLF